MAHDRRSGVARGSQEFGQAGELVGQRGDARQTVATRMLTTQDGGDRGLAPRCSRIRAFEANSLGGKLADEGQGGAVGVRRRGVGWLSADWFPRFVYLPYIELVCAQAVDEDDEKVGSSIAARLQIAERAQVFALGFAHVDPAGVRSALSFLERAEQAQQLPAHVERCGVGRAVLEFPRIGSQIVELQLSVVGVANQLPRVFDHCSLALVARPRVQPLAEDGRGRGRVACQGE